MTLTQPIPVPVRTGVDPALDLTDIAEVALDVRVDITIALQALRSGDTATADAWLVCASQTLTAAMGITP